METSLTLRFLASLTIRSEISFVFVGSPTKAPKLTASKKLSDQFSPAALNMAAAGTMEWAPAKAKERISAFWTSVGLRVLPALTFHFSTTLASSFFSPLIKLSFDSSIDSPLDMDISASIVNISGSEFAPINNSLAIDIICCVSIPKGQ